MSARRWSYFESSEGQSTRSMLTNRSLSRPILYFVASLRGPWIAEMVSGWCFLYGIFLCEEPYRVRRSSLGVQPDGQDEGVTHKGSYNMLSSASTSAEASGIEITGTPSYSSLLLTQTKPPGSNMSAKTTECLERMDLWHRKKWISSPDGLVVWRMMFPSKNQRFGCLITLGMTSTSRSRSMSDGEDGEGGEKAMRDMDILWEMEGGQNFFGTLTRSRK